MTKVKSNQGSSQSELPDGVLNVVNRSPLPAVIMEVPSRRIVVANSLARSLFSPEGSELLGRDADSLVADPPSGALELLISGRLNGFEEIRELRLSNGSLITAHNWLRKIGQEFPPRHVLAVAMVDGRPAGSAHSPLSEDFRVVMGTCDASLVIDRVSSDVVAVLGREPSDLIGQAVFLIVQPEDIPGLMWALAESNATGKGVALYLHFNLLDGGKAPCQMLISPMDPIPSFAFTLIPVQGSEDTQGLDVETLLWETRRAIEALASSRDLARLTTAHVPDLSQLSSRELVVLTSLLAGNRVPAIARELIVAQSTIRNHLSSIFRKLNVQSQQELIDLFVTKRAAAPSDK
ncbi:MAG: LuxR C-terminal-related transcriptional regulator [Acidimicrobiales bacterium]